MSCLAWGILTYYRLGCVCVLLRIEEFNKGVSNGNPYIKWLDKSIMKRVFNGKIGGIFAVVGMRVTTLCRYVVGVVGWIMIVTVE